MDYNTSGPKIGLWLNGARGSIATTAIVGLAALREGIASPIGCVTETEAFADVELAPWSKIVIGGHDIVETPVEQRAEALVRTGVIPLETLNAVRSALSDTEQNIRLGWNSRLGTEPQSAVASRLSGDIADFRSRHGLSQVVVINVSSTEPPVDPHPAHENLDLLEATMVEPESRVLPASSLVAYAAFKAGAGFVDFTPSTGARLPALQQLALREGTPFAGSDGKTGETLLRTVLAPMFRMRALRVLSWAGINLLGGGDGATLENPDNARSKISSKSGVLPALLGEKVPAPLHIDNVPDLGDHKTSWDHVSFEGFLGIPMTMQLTWACVDSTLAAPLVLDLARLLAAAQQSGVRGPVSELGFFFKDPVGTTQHALAEQSRVLVEWASSLSSSRTELQPAMA